MQRSVSQTTNPHKIKKTENYRIYNINTLNQQSEKRISKFAKGKEINYF